MFLMLFAGNEQSAPEFVAALTAAGFPAQVAADRGGFDPEPLVEFVEALGAERMPR